MVKKAMKITELEHVIFELQEQLKMMSNMLLSKEDSLAQLRIDFLQEQARKRPVIDANLWLGAKLGFIIGICGSAIITLIIVALL